MANRGGGLLGAARERLGRVVGDLSDRFTGEARQVVVLAQAEARTLGHRELGDEHLLLGVLCEEEGVAARILRAFGVSLETGRAAVVALPRDDAAPTRAREGRPASPVPFTPGAKDALEASLREALRLGQRRIATEHVLLGVLRGRDGAAAAVLRGLGVDQAALRAELVAALGG